MSFLWVRVTKFDARAAALADRHYSRQSIGARQFMPPGRTLVLLGQDEAAVWGACENMDPVGNRRLRCTIFRNEGARLSSELVREATELTQEWHAGPLRLTTEIDTRAVRKKRDPGRCFLRAGWVLLERPSRSHRHPHTVLLGAPATSAPSSS